MKPYMIGIAGPSCSGKSLVAYALVTRLPGAAVVVALDDYYRDLSHLQAAARARRNFDTPEALDEELLLDQVRMLAGGRPVQRPIYDFATHTRSTETETVGPASFVILEGLFALYWPQVRDMLHTRVFISLPGQVGLARRIERDARDRGRSRESIIRQYETSVRPMSEGYVLPTRCWADIVVSGEEPPEQAVRLILKHIEPGLR